MRKNTIVMIGIAVVFGLLAVFVAQGWLNYQAELSRKVVAPKEKPVATRTIVIAAGPLRFGTHVSADNLREVAWPEEALPAGTFVVFPPGVVHGFDNDSSAHTRAFNFHMPSFGFADHMRGRNPDFDQFDPPEDGGASPELAIVVRLSG